MYSQHIQSIHISLYLRLFFFCLFVCKTYSTTIFFIFFVLFSHGAKILILIIIVIILIIINSFESQNEEVLLRWPKIKLKRKTTLSPTSSISLYLCRLVSLAPSLSNYKKKIHLQRFSNDIICISTVARSFTQTLSLPPSLSLNSFSFSRFRVKR